MTTEEIKKVVTCGHKQKFRVKLADGTSKVVRLWCSKDGQPCIIDKGRRNWGHYLNSGWNFETKDWVSLMPVEKKVVDIRKRLIKRATAAQKMLAESGLWGDIKDEIDAFLSLPEDEMEKFMEDVENDRLFGAAWDKKYSWFHTYQVFESFLRNTCWKSINFHKRDREYEVGRIQEALKNKTGYRTYWTKGYDNSIEVALGEDRKMRAWYSEEFRGCANGHYYLMFDATHAIFYEDD